MLRTDEGSLQVGDTPVEFRSPRDAWAHGIALVHQHFTLVPALSVAENLALGSRRPVDEVRVRARALVEQVGLGVPLDAPVSILGVGDRQRVEILKTLLRDPRILVLDEPTAVLAPGEIEGLFTMLRRLAGEGRAVVLVAHKLDEVLSVADRVTVLRGGRTVASGPSADWEPGALVREMVGGEVSDAIAAGVGVERVRETRSKRTPPEPARASAVELNDVWVTASGSGAGVRSATLRVGRGEIVGVAGVEGNGQRELALVLAGRVAAERGSVRLPDGIGFIPQDRVSEGLIEDFDLTQNLALALHREGEFRSGPWLRWDRIGEVAEELRARYGVLATSVATKAGTLSGGNQQRVVVAREVRMARGLLVAENPTRGLDVSAAAFVHTEMERLSTEGVPVVLISTDLDEVLALCDRIYVMSKGRLSEVPDGRRDRSSVGALMLAAVDE
jgi:simple sugar transport system ATP-binding protein